MRDLDLEGLKVRIAGEYSDAFLYADRLYLATDEHLRVVNFPRLMQRSLPRDPEKLILYRYAFLQNDALYDQGNALFSLFSISKIRDFLLSAYREARNIAIGKRELERATIGLIKHSHPGVIHLEIYKDNVFLSSERGTFAFRIDGDRKLERESKLFGHPAVHMSANVGKVMYFSCAHNGLIVADFEDLNRRGKVLVLDGQEGYQEKAISTDHAYSDFICRTLANTYSYRFNSLKTSHAPTRPSTPDEKVSAFRALDVADEEARPILEGADFVSSYNNRLLRIDHAAVHIFKMDYQRRLSALEGRATSSNNFYKQTGSIMLPEKLQIGEIASGYQTVFGLVLDTDSGTLVLDDDPTGKSNLRLRLISRGENVKVRHYYRSRNYSHLVVSIKEHSVEVFADLTNYFFPKQRKHLRALRPFGSRNRDDAAFDFEPIYDPSPDARGMQEIPF